MNEKYTKNKGDAGLLRNPASPLFLDFLHRQCVSHKVLELANIGDAESLNGQHTAYCEDH